MRENTLKQRLYAGKATTSARTRCCSPRTICTCDGHPYPGTVATLLGQKDVPDSAKRKMLLDNSLRFYDMARASSAAAACRWRLRSRRKRAGPPCR